MLRLVWILFIVFSYGVSVLGQSKIDSLKQVVEQIEDDSLKIVTYSRLRQQYHRIDQNIALEYAIKAEKLAKKAGLQFSWAEAKYRKGTVLLNMALYEETEEEFNIALRVFSEFGAIGKIASIKIDQAKLLSQQAKIEEAFKLYMEALPLTRETGNKNAEARIHNYLGQLYKAQKQSDKAIEHYSKALSLVTELDFKPGISACLANLGSLYSAENNYDKAIPYLEEALRLKHDLGDKLGASRVLNNLGEIHNDRQQFDLAENYFNQALELAREVDHPLDLSIVEYGLARNAFYRQDYRKCIEMANKIVVDLSTVKDLQLAVKTYKLLAEAYEKIRRFDKAYLNAITHNQLSDSLYSEKILSVTNELEAKYQNEQKAQEIELQAIQIQKGENERSFLIAFAIAILLLMGLIYNQYRIKRKANTKLKELDHLKSDFFANISHEFRTPSA